MSKIMPSFEFNTVPTIRVEWAGARRLGESLAARFAQRRALVVTDAGLVGAGVVDPVVAGLKTAGFATLVFDAILADPPERILMQCVDQARAAGVDLVIGLGGGSSLDVAKLTAVLLASRQTLAEMAGIGNVKGARVPLVLLPTTAGTGSEVTNVAIITTGEATKLGVVAPQLYADCVLLDAELTMGLPARHTAATGIDAMVHAIEAYTGRHKKNPLSDLLARGALGLLSANLVAACRNGTDRAAREAMLLGATLAGQAFANSPVGAVHALAYPLGGHFHIAHGLSNALMLIPVLRFNARAAAPLYSELAAVLGVDPSAEAFIATLAQLIDDSGAPRRLRDVGIPEEALPLMASEAMQQTRLLVNNPVEVTEADAFALYREAF